VYFGSVLLLTVSFCVVATGLAWDRGIREPLLLALLAGLASFPLSELAITDAHSLLISTFPPELLPKLDHQAGIPEESAHCRRSDDVVESGQRSPGGEKLEIRYLANRQDHLYFSLFSDFIDAPQRTDTS
jgi:hypothetical protein